MRLALISTIMVRFRSSSQFSKDSCHRYEVPAHSPTALIGKRRQSWWYVSRQCQLDTALLTRAADLQWVLCFLAQHNSYLRRIETALSYIEQVSSPKTVCRSGIKRRLINLISWWTQAIEHTPTIVELYLVKARAQKVHRKTSLMPCQSVPT